MIAGIPKAGTIYRSCEGRSITLLAKIISIDGDTAHMERWDENSENRVLS